MGFAGKETVYHYMLTQTEKLALVGVLSILHKKGELKITDDMSKELVKKLLAGFNTD